MNRPDVTDFATDDSTRDRPIAALATSGRGVAILAGLQSSRLLLSVLRGFNERGPKLRAIRKEN